MAKSASEKSIFRVFSAFPDERMKAQQRFFLGSAVPARTQAPGVLGIHLAATPPGVACLKKLLTSGRAVTVPFCAIVIPAHVKRKLSPDVDGFREALIRNQLD
ncbi:hypothetical protein ACFWY9_35865 [Amycolatopsis sp. NPDC059027]|uniref:hypothetical protein n=1 Tax=Amycolatopsis sp. NPDC059027 TaxID=3346709 RepID=UPI00367033E6